MNIGNTEVYRISTEYDISEILTHFGSEYALHALEDKLNNVSFTSTLIEPNLVMAFETKFKSLKEQFPGDYQNINSVRQEVYSDIIKMLCNRFQLEFNYRDENIDLFSAACYLYDFLVCNRNQKMVDFFTSFIINNKDNLYNSLHLEDMKKNKDSSSAYSKKVYIDPKYIMISANINKIIDYISTLDLSLVDIFKVVFDYNIALFMDNAFLDVGNFYKNFYCSAITNIETQPIIITNIRLTLQKLVGNINSSYLDDLINNN